MKRLVSKPSLGARIAGFFHNVAPMAFRDEVYNDVHKRFAWREASEECGYAPTHWQLTPVRLAAYHRRLTFHQTNPEIATQAVEEAKAKKIKDFDLRLRALKVRIGDGLREVDEIREDLRFRVAANDRALASSLKRINIKGTVRRGEHKEDEESRTQSVAEILQKVQAAAQSL